MADRCPVGVGPSEHGHLRWTVPFFRAGYCWDSQIEARLITIARLGRPSDLRDIYNKGLGGWRIVALTMPSG